jgi:hypothetical protein
MAHVASLGAPVPVPVPVQPAGRGVDGSPPAGAGQVYVTRSGTVFHRVWCHSVGRSRDETPARLLVIDESAIGGRARAGTALLSDLTPPRRTGLPGRRRYRRGTPTPAGQGPSTTERTAVGSTTYRSQRHRAGRTSARRGARPASARHRCVREGRGSTAASHDTSASGELGFDGAVRAVGMLSSPWWGLEVLMPHAPRQRLMSAHWMRRRPRSGAFAGLTRTGRRRALPRSLGPPQYSQSDRAGAAVNSS